MPQQDVDADQAEQEVVNTWGLYMHLGNGKGLSPDFKALFDRTCAYRNAKEVADNGRVYGGLTKEQAAREQPTKKEFVDAYRAFYDKARQ